MGHHRVLIVFDNGIGNFILFTPALQALRRVWPDSEFVLTVNDDWSDFKKDAIRYQAGNLVDSFTHYGDWEGYDEVFGTLWSAPRSGTSMYTVPVKRYLPYRKCEHESRYYLSCVPGWDGTEWPLKVRFTINGLPEPKGKRIVVCNDGFHELRKFKIYSGMGKVINILRKKGGFEFVAVGTHDGVEIEYNIDLRGKISFAQMVSVVAQSHLVLCNDTAIMHAAAALWHPVVAVFGPTNEWKNGPLEGDVVVRDMPCRPCFHTSMFTRCAKRRCLNVDPQEVANKVMEKLECG